MTGPDGVPAAPRRSRCARARRAWSTMTQQAGLPVEVRRDGIAVLPAAVDAAAYRIVQESLTNALRHAGPHAGEVTVCRIATVARDRRRRRRAGSTAAQRHVPGHGIAGMRERAAGLGGDALGRGPPRRRVPRAGGPDPGRGGRA